MSSLEYGLNSAAWALLGWAACLTYERLRRWWVQRQGGHLAPIGVQTYFGTLLVVLFVVTTLFTLSNRLRTNDVAACQAQINRNNVAAANEKNTLQDAFNKVVVNALAAEGAVSDSLRQLVLNPPADAAARKASTKQLLQVLAHQSHATGRAVKAFANATAYLGEHPAVPVTVCSSGDTTPPAVTPTLAPTGTPQAPPPAPSQRDTP